MIQVVILSIYSLLLFKFNPKIIAIGALVLFLLSMPLFATWTFFTAQKLVDFGVLLLALSSAKIIYSSVVKSKK